MRFGWLGEKRSWMKCDGFWFRSMQSSSVILSNCTGVVCWNIGFCGGRLNVRPPPLLVDAGEGVIVLLLACCVLVFVFVVAAPRRELKSKPPEGVTVLVLVTVGLVVLVAALVVLLVLVFGIMTIIKSPFAIPTKEIGLSP